MWIKIYKDQKFIIFVNLKKNNKKNLGYGGVQKLAFSYCIKYGFDFCIMLHGDGQYHPKFLTKFIKLLLKNYFLYVYLKKVSYIISIKNQ